MLQMPPTTNRPQLISVLSTLRQEWQEAAQGRSLLEVEGNVALMLADLVNSFDLATHEQSQVLGPELFSQVQDMLVAHR